VRRLRVRLLVLAIVAWGLAWAFYLGGWRLGNLSTEWFIGACCAFALAETIAGWEANP
jgi:hypothetical protein